ncbi:MgtC/SapB family protein [Paenibacillus sp. 481]|uniref:MgtC/SapB family protein n=1 Tax=Paenibacillus sp. 481 TaxID=2835869 RepID=UPI001E3BC2E3|nr:MgtC/SapB family protein [Paenibacillus sp. 481]UHA74739.1 MgtC/SapB family protein [Paenibacillus sp. 481]
MDEVAVATSGGLHNPWLISNMNLGVRLLMAMLLGGLVGFEREKHNHPAGLRTHILVCLGSALIMLLSMYGFSQFIYEGNVRVDPARLATAVITGIGFLGAGTIIFTGKSIAGLTTAASLWVVAAIGLAVGAGFYFAAIITTLLVIVNLFVFNKLEQRYMTGEKIQLLTVVTNGSSHSLNQLHAYLQNNDITVKKMSLQHKHTFSNDDNYEAGQTEWQLIIGVPKSFSILPAAAEIEQIKGIRSVTLE